MPMNRDGGWIKVVLFVLAVIMLAGITKVLLDPGLGTPDESRRLLHQAGFSIVPPRGWGGSMTQGDQTASIRLIPDHSTGRQPSLTVIRLAPDDAAVDPAAKLAEFQGRPALIARRKAKYDWLWEARFERDGDQYAVRLLTQIDEVIENGRFWPFLNSFRVDKPSNSAATVPTTEPAR